MSRRVLLFDVRPDAHLPLAEQLLERGLQLVANGAMPNALASRGLPCEAFEWFAPPTLATMAAAEATRFEHALARALAQASVPPATPAETLAPRAAALAAHAYGQLLTLERLLEAGELALIVFGYDNSTVQRSLVELARRRRLPTIQLAHGLYAEGIARVAGEGFLYADRIAVFGERSRAVLEADGIAAERIHVTGAAHWDPLYDAAARIDARAARERLGLDPERPVVLWSASYGDGGSAFLGAHSRRQLEANRAVAEAVAALPGAQLIVRPHPVELGRLGLAPDAMQAEAAELDGRYLSWLREHGVTDAIVDRHDRIGAIRAADLVVVYGPSSATPEAMILERPVISFRDFPQAPLRYPESSGVLAAADAGELTAAVRALVDDPARRLELVARAQETLPELNHGHDGRATSRLADLLTSLCPAPARPLPGPAAGLRVLFCYRNDVDGDGGAATVMRATARELRELGASVHVRYDLYPDVDRYDVVHAFNAWHPAGALEQLRHLHATGAPLAWLPFYLGWRELTWAGPAVMAATSPELAESRRAGELAALADGRLAVDGMTRWTPNEPVAGFDAAVREMLACVDHVCCISGHEARLLAEATGWQHPAWTMTPHGVDAESFRDADPSPFAELTGCRDYVLCIGAVDVRKNQLLLVEALRDSGLELVLLGPSFEPEYLARCLERGEGRVVHVERVSRPLVASALAGARAHALVSFAEGAALANLEAAAAARPMVVSNRSSELEYFGDAPFVCDPCDVTGIRSAVLQAAESGQDQRWRQLADDTAERYTWRRSAEATLGAYRRLLEARRPALVLQGLRSFVSVVLAEELLRAPELLAAWDRCFVPSDDATLVIFGAGWEPGALERAIVEAAAHAGVDPGACGDLLALTGTVHDVASLARHAHALVGDAGPFAAFAALPRFEEDAVAQARALAERHWAAAA